MRKRSPTETNNTPENLPQSHLQSGPLRHHRYGRERTGTLGEVLCHGQGWICVRLSIVNISFFFRKTNSNASGKSFSELVHEKLMKNKIKQNKIIIGPRKGFKLTKQNLVRLEKLERIKNQEILEDEAGTCKYCEAVLSIKQLKEHYLQHRGENQVRDGEMDNEVILQENSISSSGNSSEERDTSAAQQKLSTSGNFNICHDVSTVTTTDCHIQSKDSSLSQETETTNICNESEKVLRTLSMYLVKLLILTFKGIKDV